jgi:hypothetical protein
MTVLDVYTKVVCSWSSCFGDFWMQTMELQYNNLCCEKCVKDIKSALYKFPGIPFPASICLLMRLTFAVDSRFLLWLYTMQYICSCLQCIEL